MTERDPGRAAAAAVDRALMSVFQPMALLAGMELGLFTALDDGPLDAASLAGRLGLDASRLERLMLALAADGWLERDGPRFSNSAVATHALVHGRPGSLAGMERLSRDLWEGLLHTADSIRTGAPAAKHDFATMDADALEQFYAGLHPMTTAAGAMLAERGLLAGARRLLDVGGGSGGVAIAACGRAPSLAATVVELPSVAPFARRYVADAGLADRVEVREGDATAAPIEGPFDVAVLRAFLQVLSEEQSRAALGHVHAALAPGARLFVLSRALDDDLRGPLPTVRFDLAFLNYYDHGRAWTDAQHRAWLADAGFVDVERETFPTGQSLFTARRP